MVVVTVRGNQTEVWPLEVHKEGGEVSMQG